MRYQYRYTKDERRHLAAANRVLDDPTAPPAEVNKALRHIQRIQDAAECRAFDRAVSEPSAPKEPTVDDLVSALESKKPLPDAPPCALEGRTALPAIFPALEVTPEAIKALEAVQAIADGKIPPAVPIPVAPTCAACGVSGNWNCFWPVDSQCGPFCPACFGKLCSADMLASAKAAAEADWPADWAADLNDKRHVYSDDYQKSVELWRQQDIETATRQEQERAERDRAEAQFHAARARWIQDGGKL